MEVGTQSLLTGLAVYGLIIICSVLLVWLAVRAPQMMGWVADAVRERWDARRARQAPQAQGPPVEALAADLRRLRAELLYHPPTNAVRRNGLLMAYDSVLRDLCARLEIETELEQCTAEFDREVERLRAESAVQEAGVSLQVRRPSRPEP
jgi:hypothetical protein